MQTIAFRPTNTRPVWIRRLWRPRLVIGGVILGMVAAASAWQWSWLVAIGVAPLLLSLAPCAAMCGLGLCMSRVGGGACRQATQGGQTVSQPQANNLPVQVQ